jgi:hypothetical protein
MPAILIVEKNAQIKQYVAKAFSEEDLFKKAGFKSAAGFKCQTSWSVPQDETTYTYYLYGKTTGRAGQENKYEFPPPVDSVLYFGSCVIVKKQGEKVLDTSPKEWEEVYEYLYGGFEDIGTEDSDEEEESDDGVARTKDGYAKDGFVVEDDSFDETESDEEPVVVVPKKKPTKAAKKNAVVVHPEIDVDETESYLQCTDELVEEDYL